MISMLTILNSFGAGVESVFCGNNTRDAR